MRCEHKHLTLKRKMFCVITAKDGSSFYCSLKRCVLLLLSPPGGIVIGRVCWSVCLFVCLFVRLVSSLASGHCLEVCC